jgi:hypothetical protein
MRSDMKRNRLRVRRVVDVHFARSLAFVCVADETAGWF